MTDQRKLSVSLILALGTFALVGSMALVGLINTIRWLAGLPPEADLSTLPPQIVLGILKLVLQFLACLVGFMCVIYASRKFAFGCSIIAVGVLLLLHIASWLFGPATLGASFLAKYGLRIGFAVWLVALLIALVPNNSFKPKPLRGSA
jgi:hypothetical protein